MERREREMENKEHRVFLTVSYLFLLWRSIKRLSKVQGTIEFLNEEVRVSGKGRCQYLYEVVGGMEYEMKLVRLFATGRARRGADDAGTGNSAIGRAC